jgi:hypothetical protein
MSGLDAWSKSDDVSLQIAWGPLAGAESGAHAVIISWMLDLAGLALRQQVTRPSPRFFELSSILARLSAGGTMGPDANLEALGAVFTHVAAIAGGVRPPLQPLLDAYWDDGLFRLAGLAITFGLTSLVDLTGRSTAEAVRDLTVAARENGLEPPAGATWSG